ncbi:MAG: universal stress protein [Chloroflexi bacterium]|nr:universal stress protein [Chloroflexota bacterium]
MTAETIDVLGVRFQTLTRRDAAAEIAKYAASERADLIIMTTHGEGTTDEKVRTGSVAMRVISTNEIR